MQGSASFNPNRMKKGQFKKLTELLYKITYAALLLTHNHFLRRYLKPIHALF